MHRPDQPLGKNCLSIAKGPIKHLLRKTCNPLKVGSFEMRS